VPSSPTTTPIDIDELSTVASELGGSEWMVERRLEAARRFAASDLPSDDDEEWRYSRIGDLDLAAYALHPLADAVSPEEAAVVPDLSSLRVEVVDGRLMSTAGLDDVDGITVAVVDSAENDPWPVDDGLDAFDHLNVAVGPGAIRISVAAGAVIERPIQVTSRLTTPSVLTAPRVVIDMGENSELTVIDWFTSDDSDRLSLPRYLMRLGQSSRLRWLGVQDLGRSTVSLGRQVAVLGRDSSLSVTYTALGGSSSRMRFDTELSGQGSTARLNAVYYGDGRQHHDLRTFPSHVAPDTTSLLDFRGALDGAATAVYTGLVHVGRDARGTNAEQSNRIIKLSEEAWAESVPNLEIHNNDVRCAHSSAVGPIDADQRFYLESRGVDPATAEQLVVSGLFADLLAETTMGSFATVVTDRIARRWKSGS
jgi:Fe-S cluster assembly protein SufD